MRTKSRQLEPPKLSPKQCSSASAAPGERQLRQTSPRRNSLPAEYALGALGDIRDVEQMTSMKRSYLLREVRLERFPAPVIRQFRCTRWRLSEVSAWIEDRIKQAATDSSKADATLAQAKKASAVARANRMAATGTKGK
jgi:predicted DNA-binding transcriptional regulator AlpA